MMKTRYVAGRCLTTRNYAKCHLDYTTIWIYVNTQFLHNRLNSWRATAFEVRLRPGARLRDRGKSR
jgi:hypothetical protein